MSEETKKIVNDIGDALMDIPAEEAKRIRDFAIGAAAMVRHESEKEKNLQTKVSA